MIGQIDGELPPIELYNLGRGPLEKNNLSGQAQYAQIQSELSAKLYDWMHTTGDPLLDGAIASPRYNGILEGFGRSS